jgi:hypothetical protein
VASVVRYFGAGGVRAPGRANASPRASCRASRAGYRRKLRRRTVALQRRIEDLLVDIDDDPASIAPDAHALAPRVVSLLPRRPTEKKAAGGKVGLRQPRRLRTTCLTRRELFDHRISMVTTRWTMLAVTKGGKRREKPDRMRERPGNAERYAASTAESAGATPNTASGDASDRRRMSTPSAAACEIRASSWSSSSNSRRSI